MSYRMEKNLGAPLKLIMNKCQGNNAIEYAYYILCASILLIGFYIFFSTSLMMVKNWCPVLYWDQWGIVGLEPFTELKNYFSLHNEHRDTIVRLLILIDVIFGQKNIALLTFIFFFSLITAIAMSWLYRQANGGKWRIETLGVLGISLAFCFSAVQAENFTMGFQGFTLVTLLVGAGFAVLANGRSGTGTVTAVIVLEILATYTLASGLVFCFMAIVWALWLGHPRRNIALFTIAALALTVSYFWGYTLPNGNVAHGAPSRHLATMAAYVLTEVGAPFSIALSAISGRDFHWGTMAIGSIGVLSCVVLGLFLLAEGKRANRFQLMFLGISGWALTMALVTAVGRAHYGVQQALASRYATPMLMFWGAVLLILLLRYRRAMPLFLIGGFAATTLLAAAQPREVELAGRSIEARRAAIPTLLAGTDDRALLGRLYSLHPVLQRQRQVLAQHRLSVFADDWANWLGTRLEDHVRLADGSQCGGGADIAIMLDDPDQPSGRMIGRAWDSRASRPIERLILADASGRVVGYGLGQLGVDAVSVGYQPASTSMSDQTHDWWIGNFQGADPSVVTAYALIGDGQTACPLGTPAKALAGPKTQLSTVQPTDLPLGGFVDLVASSDDRNTVSITGWGQMFPRFDEPPSVMIATDLPVTETRVAIVPRPDVVAALNDQRLSFSGFQIELELDQKAEIPRNPHLCVWTDDVEFGRHLLMNPSRPELCPAAVAK